MIYAVKNLPWKAISTSNKFYCFCLVWSGCGETELIFFAVGNLTVYDSPRQIKSQDFRGQDFFVVRDTERKPRKSWVVWEEEGKYPKLMIELRSDSTAKVDRGRKKQIYQKKKKLAAKLRELGIDPETFI